MESAYFFGGAAFDLSQGSVIAPLWGALVSFLTIVASVMTGSYALNKLGVFNGPLRLHLACGLGICLQGLSITLVSLAGVAYWWVLTTLWAFPLLVGILTYRQWLPLVGVGNASTDRNSIGILGVLIWVFIGFYWLYAASSCFGYFRGADIPIYHLVIPRDIIWHHGFYPNPFFFAAGIPQAWHHYGAPAYLLAKEPGYLGLSFWCFVGVCLLIKDITRLVLPECPPLTPLFTMFATALVSVGMLEGSISNNDIPGVYLELILMVGVIQLSKKGVSRSAPYVIGILGGFILGVKLTNLVGVALLTLMYLYLNREAFFAVSIRVALSLLLCASIWPVVNLVFFGSPLPQCLDSLRVFGTTLPQFRVTTAAMADVHGNWCLANAGRLFTGNMLPVPILAFGVVLLPWKKLPARSRQLVLFGLGFAALRFLGVCALSPRLDIIFHNRYHLIDFIIILALGITGWESFGAAVVSTVRKVTQVVTAVILLVLFLLNIFIPYRIVYPDAHFPERIEDKIPSLWNQMCYQWRMLGQPPPWQQQAIVTYIRTKTPPNALIATLVMGVYDYDRRFIQILPFAQTRIDITASPATILNELKHLGVRYLHVVPFSGLIPGLTPKMVPWLTLINAIGKLPGVKLVVKVSIAPGLDEELYQILYP